MHHHFFSERPHSRSSAATGAQEFENFRGDLELRHDCTANPSRLMPSTMSAM